MNVSGENLDPNRSVSPALQRVRHTGNQRTPADNEHPLEILADLLVSTRCPRTVEDGNVERQFARFETDVDGIPTRVARWMLYRLLRGDLVLGRKQGFCDRRFGLGLEVIHVYNLHWCVRRAVAVSGSLGRRRRFAIVFGCLSVGALRFVCCDGYIVCSEQKSSETVVSLDAQYLRAANAFAASSPRSG